MGNIFFLGDIHGFYERLLLCNKWVEPNDIIIQVGDFEVDKNLRQDWGKIGPSMKCSVYFIDGNHEDHGLIATWDQVNPTKVGPNLFYVPRGYVGEFNGKRIGFLGGAESVDKMYQGSNWFSAERINQNNVNTLLKNVDNKPLDILVTHTPPTFAITANFPKLNKKSWNLPEDWEDVSSKMVEQAYVMTNPNKLICGHMHKSVLYNNVRILDINELLIN